VPHLTAGEANQAAAAEKQKKKKKTKQNNTHRPTTWQD
jgi:hypothetical protein